MVYETCVCKNEKRETICEACSLGNNLGEWQCLHTSPSLLCHWLTWGKPNSLSARQIWDDYIPFPQTLSLRPPLAPAVFCNLRSANRSRRRHFPLFSLPLNFSPRKRHFSELLYVRNNIKRLQSVHHRETGDATTSRLSTTMKEINANCTFFKKRTI